MKKIVFVVVSFTTAFLVSCATVSAPKPFTGSTLEKIRDSFEFADTDPIEGSVAGDISLSLSDVTLPQVSDLVVYYGIDDDDKTLVGSTLVEGFQQGTIANLEQTSFSGEEKLFLYLKNTAFTTGVNEVFSGVELAVVDLIEEVDFIEEDEVNERVTTGENLNHILFAFDKFELTTEAIAILDDFANSVADIALVEISIAGHTDERGSNQYNLALGEKRATAIKDYLIILGALEENIETLSFGEEIPICSQATEPCWQENRRAETTFYIISE